MHVHAGGCSEFVLQRLFMRTVAEVSGTVAPDGVRRCAARERECRFCMQGAQFRFVDGVRRRTQPRGRIPRSTTDELEDCLPIVPADESFNVVVVGDCCAAAMTELHEKELETINMIYCHVVRLDEALCFFTA